MDHNTSDDVEDDDHQCNHGSPSVLSLNHIQGLHRLYVHTYPELKIAADSQPQKEDRTEELSTGAMLSNCTAPSKEITRYKAYTLKGQHNRSIRFGSVLSEHENCSRVVLCSSEQKFDLWTNPVYF